MTTQELVVPHVSQTIDTVEAINAGLQSQKAGPEAAPPSTMRAAARAGAATA
jgi:hypothetical protein